MTQPKPRTVVTIISVVVLVVGSSLAIGTQLWNSGGTVGALQNRLTTVESQGLDQEVRIRKLERSDARLAVLEQRLGSIEVKINKTGDKVDALYTQIVPYAERNRDKP